MSMPPLIHRNLHAGFSLVSAIFLIVVLAGLGVAMMFISTMQHQSSALDIQGVRAYQAARAGIEWGLFQRVRAAGNSGCFANTNITFPAGTSLQAFTVTVSCASNLNSDINALGASKVPSNIQPAIITAVACNMPNGAGNCVQGQASTSPDFILRVVEVRL